jgi:hypothetical protein
MIKFSTRILKFGNKGEKTGWRYIEISKQQAEKINPGCKVSFRIKGKLDNHVVEKTALLPMGDGNFILPLNADIRKATAKKEGDLIKVQLDHDKRELTPSADFIQCLKDESAAFDFFKTLPKSHQTYFSKWIDSAKTMNTKAKRITMAVIALAKKQGYGEMIRANKGNR